MTRTEKIEKLIAYHNKTFKRLQVEEPFYKPLMFYNTTINKKNERVVSFFQSEMEMYSKEHPYIYFEEATKESELVTPNKRVLYRYHCKPNYEETVFSKINASGNPYYIVPIDELEVVSIDNIISDSIKLPVTKIKTARKPVEEVEEEDDLMIPDPNTDLPMSSMTMRDYAAIKLRAPLSHKGWLNEMIKIANK